MKFMTVSFPVNAEGMSPDMPSGGA
jgi:hypothetical protein